MTIKARFALLLGVLLGGFLLAALVVRAQQNATRQEMIAAENESRVRMLGHWIEATSRTLPQFAADLAESDELNPALIAAPGEEIQQKLATALASAGLRSLWLVRADGSVRLQTPSPGGSPEELPLEPSEFASLVRETPSPRFFVERNRELLEIAIRRVHPARAADMLWVVVAKTWGESQLRSLENLVEAKVSLRPAHEVATTSADAQKIALLRPLHDWRGRVIRVLRVELSAAEIERAVQIDTRQTRTFMVFGLCVVAAMAVTIYLWVLRPLHKITTSLATDNPRLVEKLAEEKSELGRVAQLIASAFRQHEDLKREVEERTRTQAALQLSEETLRQNLQERARLGRDLHDGVIQSLYAAGMGLAGIRAQLLPNQSEAATRLEQTRATLNETIHDVRNFIDGLEPEALKRQTFSQAVSALLQGMAGMREFKSSLQIDETVAHRLTLAQRVHALQIAREAISNALRHGAANTIGITLQLRGDSVEFKVADDGTGFDPGSTGGAGKGLANFVQRAHELGADLTVQSQPGGGTSVNLTFSLLML